MENNLWIQKGYNCLWPYEIETWRWGEPIPEWISDRAGIEWVDGEGNLTLKTRGLIGGGIEILKSGSSEALIRLKDLRELVYISPLHSKKVKLPSGISPTPIIKEPKVITPAQLELLYRPKK